MFGLGFSELVALAILALILLGPEQLPDLARTLGRFINDLKKTTDGLKDEFNKTGLNPQNLLEDIRKEADQPIPPQPPLTEADFGGQHHEEEKSVEKTQPTGNKDSGKKSDPH